MLDPYYGTLVNGVWNPPVVDNDVSNQEANFVGCGSGPSTTDGFHKLTLPGCSKRMGTFVTVAKVNAIEAIDVSVAS